MITNVNLTEEQKNQITAFAHAKPVTIGRNESQKKILELIGFTFGLNPINMIETGTSRNRYESPDGWGTVFMAYWGKIVGSRVSTVDINESHLDACRHVTRDYDNVDHILSDSIEYLKNYPGKIHLLYLDSYDFDQTEECYQHQLKEIQAAHDKLEIGAIVVSDDNYKSDWSHGKGNYSIPWMLNNGYELIDLIDTQAILQKVK